jgi:hypothetical protein
MQLEPETSAVLNTKLSVIIVFLMRSHVGCDAIIKENLSSEEVGVRENPYS